MARPALKLSFPRQLVAPLLLAAMLAGCKTQQATFLGALDDNVEVQTNGWGLRKLDTKDYPDMKLAWMDKTGLEKAIQKSRDFLGKPSSRRFYPSNNPGDTITHDQVDATLADIQLMIRKNISPEQFQQEIISRYDVYTSVGYNSKGDVWFTGYFTPQYEGSRTRTGEYQYPIYSRPADLVSDPITGEVKGTYATRRELESSGKLRGLELIYFKKPIEPFLVQVQGSAQVTLPDRTVLYVGYAGSNGRDALGLGTQLRDEGKIDAKHLSLPAVLAYFDQHPDELQPHIMKDDRFTFLKIYTDAERAEWPTGSLNAQVTTDRSLATDKRIFPRASLTFIDVPKPTTAGTVESYKGFALDQDTGGAIRAAGRADIYMGIGDAAGRRAGLEYAQGRLYYVFLKPQYVQAAPAAPALTRVVPNSPNRAGGQGQPVPANRPPGADEMFPGAVPRQ